MYPIWMVVYSILKILFAVFDDYFISNRLNIWTLYFVALNGLLTYSAHIPHLSCVDRGILTQYIKSRERHPIWQDFIHSKPYCVCVLEFHVTCNDISLYMWRQKCAGGLKNELDLRSGSQRHRHFVGFFYVPVQAPTRGHPFYTVNLPI